MKITASALCRFLARRLVPHAEAAIEAPRMRRAADEIGRSHRFHYVLRCDAEGHVTGFGLRDRATGQLR